MFLRPALAASALILLAASSAAATIGPALELKRRDILDRSAVSVQTPDLEARAVPIFMAALMAVNFAVLIFVSASQSNGFPWGGSSEDMHEVVRMSRKQDPAFNFVIVHSEHTVNFNGQEGIDWAHNTTITLTGGTTSKYDLYSFKSGEVTLKGDAGDDKWAYAGNITLVDQDGKHVVFAEPSLHMSL